MLAPIVSAPGVAELQGLYGAFSFSEKLLQKIWLRGDFDRGGARTMDGRPVRIMHPGKWNLLGGPDFTGARLMLGVGADREIVGDVEVHLHASDWDAHGHASDPAYDRVVLHVVLFPPESARVTRGAGGSELPVLVLLPLLHRGLEEFAGDEAVEVLANRTLARLPDELGVLPAAELTKLLQRQAGTRWRQKVRFAGLRVERLGWDAACHHAALEILGYRFNRAPMLRIALQWPLERWANGDVDVDLILATEGEGNGWSVQGVRPANHPRVRLRQYAEWTRARPDWPAGLRAMAHVLPVMDAADSTRPVDETRGIRRVHRFAALRELLCEEIAAEVVGGTRWDTLVCDGLLPLLAADMQRPFDGAWYHWYAGDLPPFVMSGLRQLGYFDGRTQPACHGAAQGLLAWFLEREARPEMAAFRAGRGA